MESNLQKKIDFAISLIQSAAKMAESHGQPLEVCYSGGKDSDVILELARMSGVNYRAIYKNTTIDPPGTILHAKENGAEIMQPQMTFMQIMEKKGLPSRYRRTCCEILKEYKVLDYAIVGVRRSESVKRARIYKEPEMCRVYRKGIKCRQYLPILEWSDDDISSFIKERKVRCHPLYYDNNGEFHVERRLGCLGCPLASKNHRIAQFKRYPQMVKFYILGGQRFLDAHPESKMHGYFRDSYEWFTFTLYCDGLKEWNEIYNHRDLFGDTIDCKRHLEETFKIHL